MHRSRAYYTQFTRDSAIAARQRHINLHWRATGRIKLIRANIFYSTFTNVFLYFPLRCYVFFTFLTFFVFTFCVAELSRGKNEFPLIINARRQKIATFHHSETLNRKKTSNFDVFRLSDTSKFGVL